MKDIMKVAFAACEEGLRILEKPPIKRSKVIKIKSKQTKNSKFSSELLTIPLWNY